MQGTKSSAMNRNLHQRRRHSRTIGGLSRFLAFIVQSPLQALRGPVKPFRGTAPKFATGRDSPPQQPFIHPGTRQIPASITRRCRAAAANRRRGVDTSPSPSRSYKGRPRHFRPSAERERHDSSGLTLRTAASYVVQRIRKQPFVPTHQHRPRLSRLLAGTIGSGRAGPSNRWAFSRIASFPRSERLPLA